jgi:hypothetical protein
MAIAVISLGIVSGIAVVVLDIVYRLINIYNIN